MGRHLSLASIRFRAKRRLINSIIDASNEGRITPQERDERVAGVYEAYEKRSILMALSDKSGVRLDVLIERSRRQIEDNTRRAEA